MVNRLGTATLYGCARLGSQHPEALVYPRLPNQLPADMPAGSKRYELTNHLGNVLSTVSDLLTPVDTDNNTTTDHFAAIVHNQQAYYPFGMLMPGLEYATPGTGNTRFGFNGQVRSDEVYGKGKLNTALFWEYDTRLGRRWNLDPKPVPSYSEYSTFINNPLYMIDEKGDTVMINLFSKSDSPFYPASDKLIKDKNNYKDGVFIIAAHGDPYHIEDNRGSNKNNMQPEDLKKELENNPLYKQAVKEGITIKIILASCNTAKNVEKHFGKEEVKRMGYPTKTFAERFSAILTNNDFLIAPDGYVIFNTRSTLKANEKSIVRTGYGGIQGLDQDGSGTDNIPKWHLFQRGKRIEPKTLLKK